MNKIQAGQLIHALAQACARASHCFDNVPDLIINIIKNKLWKNFIVDESKKEVSYTKFEDFVSAKVPEGLETTMKTLENICRDDEEATSLLTLATKRPRGRPKKEPELVVEETPEETTVPPEEVIQEGELHEEEETPEKSEEIAPPRVAASQQKIVSNIHDKAKCPKGTKRATGHRRLESQRPDLHKKVLDGEMSVHKACLEAGFRKKVFSISGDPISAARTIANNYDKDDIKKLIDELTALL